jgi:type IV pilus assembly protein PilO
LNLSSIKLPKLDFQTILEEFKTLDPQDPGMWPLFPRIVILSGIFAALIMGAWLLGWNGQTDELNARRREEATLKEQWLDKKRKAVNLDEYRRQLAEIDRSFGTLLRQLPNRAEMDGLLVDINQAGLGRGLQFELFKPGPEVIRDFYAEVPISVKLTGSYHDLGSFAGDAAKMHRIVTLNDLDVSVAKDGSLSMSAVVKTFRYLDSDEVARQRRQAGKSGSVGGRK